MSSSGFISGTSFVMQMAALRSATAIMVFPKPAPEIMQLHLLEQAPHHYACTYACDLQDAAASDEGVLGDPKPAPGAWRFLFT